MGPWPPPGPPTSHLGRRHRGVIPAAALRAACAARAARGAGTAAGDPRRFCWWATMRRSSDGCDIFFFRKSRLNTYIYIYIKSTRDFKKHQETIFFFQCLQGVSCTLLKGWESTSPVSAHCEMPDTAWHMAQVLDPAMSVGKPTLVLPMSCASRACNSWSPGLSTVSVN